MMPSEEKKNKFFNIKKAGVILISAIIITSTYTLISITKDNDIGSIRINEIMYNPLGSDSGREWIEIYNTAEYMINISGWRLFEGNVNHTIILVSGSYEIPAHSFAIIADDYEDFLIDYPGYSKTLIDSSFKLLNSGEYLAIKNATLEIIDDVDYSPRDGANDTGMSIEYKSEDKWMASTTDGGTPGEPNSVWLAPCKPIDPYPENNWVNVSINTTLSVNVTDFDNDSMNVFFYNGQDDNLIDVAENIPNATRAEVQWLNLEYNTTYYWYAVANDSLFENTSDIWCFTTVNQEDENSPPNTPSNPDPENDSENISIDTNLDWDGDDPDEDPVTFDVYFGTNSTPPKVAGNLTTSSYDLDTLDLDTLYYWKIFAWDNHSASTTSPLWCFTTRGNLPPEKPNSPSPSDGSIGVDANADLSWQCTDPDNDALTFDVYLEENDTTPDVLVSNDQSSTTFNPGKLNYNSTYYWQIVATDINEESTEGPVWEFTTENPLTPVVEISKPQVKSFYFKNKRMFSLLFNCFIYGPITIEANVISDTEIEKVQFFINGKLKVEDFEAPYSYEWSPTICSIYKIKVVAIDTDGQSSEDEMTVLKWRMHPILLLLGSFLMLKQIVSPFTWSLVRGTVLNLNHVGNMVYTRALRLHFTELGVLSRCSGVTKLQRVKFRNSPFLRTFDIGPMGLTKYIIGIVPGKVE